MPITSWKNVESGKRRADKEGDIPAHTILLIDDDEKISHMVAMLLEHIGYTAIFASGGNEALAVLESKTGEIGCVLTDLTMPDMDGLEILSLVKKISPEMPVVLASGYDETHVLNSRPVPIPPDAYIQKPFQIAELKTTLERILGKT